MGDSCCAKIHRSRSHGYQPEAKSRIAQVLRGQESQAFGPPQEVDAGEEARSDTQRGQRQICQGAEEDARLARPEVRRQGLKKMSFIIMTLYRGSFFLHDLSLSP